MSPVNVTNGQIHSAKVEIVAYGDIASKVNLILNSAVQQSDTFPSNTKDIGVFSDPENIKNIFIGGKPASVSSAIDPIDFLRGCVISFKIDDVRHQLDIAVTDYVVDVIAGEESGTSAGCDGSDVCAVKPCREDEICKDIW